MGLLLGGEGLVFSWGFGFALSVMRVVNGMGSVTGVLLEGPQMFIGVYSCGDRVNLWGKSQKGAVFRSVLFYTQYGLLAE